MEAGVPVAGLVVRATKAGPEEREYRSADSEYPKDAAQMDR
jgi:hypothetical protein